MSFLFTRPKGLAVLIVGSVVVAIGFFVWIRLQAYVDDEAVETADFAASRAREKVAPVYAKGLYLTAYSANDPAKRAEIIDLINRTELNSVVIDIKDYTGYILYDRDDDERGVWIARDVMEDPAAIVDEFHRHGIYVIARQTVMQDPAFAERFPEYAVRRAGGGVWRDYKGLAWVDPTQEAVWEYNLRIAKHAISLGFDEINFDYVRFPSDGDLSVARYAHPFERRHAVMREFFAYMWLGLEHEPAYVSFDVFGLTLDNRDFDLNIGQRMRDIVDVAHYVSPMIYPSHYPSGYAGFENPAAYPYDVVRTTMSAGQQHFATSTRAQLRPWLQAFNIGATYHADRIRAQIRAVEEQDHVAGWFLWNARNVYTNAGLELAE